VNVQEQVPRNALAWIVICLFTVVAPHAARVPLWVLVVYLAAVTWRVQVHRGRWSFPGRWVKVAMTATCIGGIYASYRSVIGLEPTVALLLTAFALKLTELARRKDAYVLLFLGYFVCITEFLFSQDLLITLYSLLNVVLITTALVALHQPWQQQFNSKPLWLATRMLAQAVPMMLVLFFLFPRLGPLWTVPVKSHTAKTGMSDFMRPGDVASLSKSDEVAFRVKFEGDIPPQSELYWRGLVLSRMQQGAWTTLSYYDLPAAERSQQPVAPAGEPLEYSVIMAPTQQHWLFGLHYARSPDSGVMHAPEYRMFSLVPIEAETLYRARSWLDYPVGVELSDWRRRTETSLPAEANPRTRALAAALRDRAASDEGMVEAVLERFNREAYVYTLNPGVLTGRDTIDSFLFDTRRGFCEHYASAFVLLMRAAGIPARVVAGYQGGEVNPVNRTVIVHQFDAHAWAEVWLPEQGWVRVDPTAAVAPERIEQGLEEAVEGEGSFLADSPLSPLRYRSIPLVNLLRLRYDALTYRWQSWIVGYDNERQFALLQDFFGEISGRVFATVLLGSWALVLIPVSVALLRRPRTRERNPADRVFLQFCQRLAALGVARGRGEAPGEYGRRAALALPEYAGQLLRITELYSRLAYHRTRAVGLGAAEMREFRLAVARFRPDRRRRRSGS